MSRLALLSLSLQGRDLDLFLAGFSAAKADTWMLFARAADETTRDSHQKTAAEFERRAVYYMRRAGVLPPASGAVDRVICGVPDDGAARPSVCLSPPDGRSLPAALRALATRPWRIS